MCCTVSHEKMAPSSPGMLVLICCYLQSFPSCLHPLNVSVKNLKGFIFSCYWTKCILWVTEQGEKTKQKNPNLRSLVLDFYVIFFSLVYRTFSLFKSVSWIITCPISVLLQTKCFICGIGSEYFDTVPHGFETHTLQEHNLANYLWVDLISLFIFSFRKN